MARKGRSGTTIFFLITLLLLTILVVTKSQENTNNFLTSITGYDILAKACIPKSLSEAGRYARAESPIVPGTPIRRFEETERLGPSITDVSLKGDKNTVLKQADEVIEQADRPGAYGEKTLGQIDSQVDEGPVTAILFETNGYKRAGQEVVDDTGKVQNELQYANTQGHEEYGDKVVKNSIENFDEVGKNVVEKYNINHPDAPIEKVEGYTRVGPRGTGIFISGDVKYPDDLTDIVQEELEAQRKTFLNDIPGDVSQGEITGFKASIGYSDSAEQAYKNAEVGFGGYKLKGSETIVGSKHSPTTVVDTDKLFNDIQQGNVDELYLDYTRPSYGVYAPDPANPKGLSLKQQYDEARAVYNANPSDENLKKLNEIVNEINYKTNTNQVTGAPNLQYARQNIASGEKISAGGEENFILFKTRDGTVHEVYSDVDNFGTVNREMNLELADKTVKGQVDIENLAVGKEADAGLARMQEITQRNLDQVPEGEVVSVTVVDNIRKDIATETGMTRSYAMFNSADGVVPGRAADPNVERLVSDGQIGGTGVGTYNEMVIGVAKNNGKNGVAVLETISSDGKSGTVRLINDQHPEGIVYQVSFDQKNAKATITG